MFCVTVKSDLAEHPVIIGPFRSFKAVQAWLRRSPLNEHGGVAIRPILEPLPWELFATTFATNGRTISQTTNTQSSETSQTEGQPPLFPNSGETSSNGPKSEKDGQSGTPSNTTDDPSDSGSQVKNQGQNPKTGASSKN